MLMFVQESLKRLHMQNVALLNLMIPEFKSIEEAPPPPPPPPTIVTVAQRIYLSHLHVRQTIDVLLHNDITFIISCTAIILTVFWQNLFCSDTIVMADLA